MACYCRIRSSPMFSTFLKHILIQNQNRHMKQGVLDLKSASKRVTRRGCGHRCAAWKGGVQVSLSQFGQVRTTCRLSDHSSIKSQHELLHSLFNNMVERGVNPSRIKTNLVKRSRMRWTLEAVGLLRGKQHFLGRELALGGKLEMPEMK